MALLSWASIDDLQLVRLTTHADARGDLTELFRDDWVDDRPVQWNLVHSRPNTLRGVHVHVRHSDYIVVLAGSMLIGLCDVRAGHASFMTSRFIELTSDNPTLLRIPPGIAHGFYFAQETTFMYGVTSYWDPVEDELGCRWDDPELKLPWPARSPLLSARDATAQSCAMMLEETAARTLRC